MLLLDNREQCKHLKQCMVQVDATYNLACHLQKEKDALHAMVQGIRGELLSSTVKERPESPGLLKMLGFGRGQENKDSTSTYQEQDHFQIFAIIKEQKIRLLRAQGTAEVGLLHCSQLA